MNTRIGDNVIKVTFIISFLSVWANLIWDLLDMNSPIQYNVIMGVMMTLFAFFHGKKYFGLKNISVLLILTAIISFIMEHIGVTTGLIYGDYHYGDMLGPRIINTVPFIIPLAWFMFMYAGVVITNEVLSNSVSIKDFIKQKSSIVKIITYAIIDSIVMTALDILIDPIWVSKGTWIWTDVKNLPAERVFYNIPVQNYFGWLLTTFIIFIIFRTIFFRSSKVFSEKDRGYFFPVFNYISIFIVGTIEAWILLKNSGLVFISLMTSGFISLLVSYKIYEFYKRK